LFSHLSAEGRFSEDRSRFYAGELLLALEHLHAFNVGPLSLITSSD
jgi:serum/glucocorticoid-regulated kinase 2